jgi:hypothetical protein
MTTIKQLSAIPSCIPPGWLGTLTPRAASYHATASACQHILCRSHIVHYMRKSGVPAGMSHKAHKWREFNIPLEQEGLFLKHPQIKVSRSTIIKIFKRVTYVENKVWSIFRTNCQVPTQPLQPCRCGMFPPALNPVCKFPSLWSNDILDHSSPSPQTHELTLCKNSYTILFTGKELHDFLYHLVTW